MNKDKAIDIVNDLPDEFELEEFLEKLIFIDKIENGLKQLETKQVVSQDKLKEIVKKW